MKRRSLGQHYLRDERIVKRVVELAAIGNGERVLEIGTGRGTLTAELAKVADSLEAYEIDRENYLATKSLLNSRVKMRLGDAFKARPRFDVLVSSLPYSESSTFVEWLSGLAYDRAVVILQEDFARKITANPGERNYRAVSVIAQLSADISLKNPVPRHAFHPPPLVNSRMVVFVRRRRLTGKKVVLIRLLFSLRRRRVKAALSKLGFDSSVGTSLGSRRVNSLGPEEVDDIISAFSSDNSSRRGSLKA
jgi:16S rRNA (adenine1518-N6/adenine1519-N6)-dimethyltransferase